MNSAKRILSVCRGLPAEDHPASHNFVLQRIAAMGRLADLRAIEPVPYFPLLKPLPAETRLRLRRMSDVEIQPLPMLYLPGVQKHWDARWMHRSIAAYAKSLQAGSGVDVLDAQFGYPEGVSCVRLASEMGIPSFVTLRGFEVDLMEVPKIREPLLASLNAATGCICVSHSLREIVVANGVRPDRVTVIHNAVDRAVFKPGNRDEARQLLGLAGRGPLIVSVGRQVSGKRHHVLIDAFNRLRQKYPDAVLCIIGAASFEGDYPKQLARMAQAGGVQSVRLPGALTQRDVVRWLQAADMFALATAREGCCNAVLEALAVGTPVVTTPAGDNAHFVVNDVNGYLVPIDDPVATGDALQRVLENTAWDPARISSGLAVGGWDRVAAEVLAYFAERINNCKRSGTTERLQ